MDKADANNAMNNTTPRTPRTRGRPAKEPLTVSQESINEVKQMLKGKSAYSDARNRCEILPEKRPTLMRKLKVNTDCYEADGRIEYDRELASRIHKDDRDYIELYEQSMRTVWILEHGVASIPSKRTRAIAEDTLLKGQRTEDMMHKYGIGRRSAFMERNIAIRHIASFIEKMESD